MESIGEHVSKTWIIQAIKSETDLTGVKGSWNTSFTGATVCTRSYLLCCISRRSVSAHMIRKVNTTMTTSGRKNSVSVRTSIFERQQPECWKAVDRKE